MQLPIDKIRRLDDASPAFECGARKERFAKAVPANAQGPVVVQTTA
jgi:hypothetical protein